MSIRVMAILLLFGLGQSSFGQSRPGRTKTNLAKEITGVWALVDKPTDTASAGSRLKFIMNGYWSMTQVDTMSHVTIFHHGGSYTLADSIYSEKIGYANGSTANYIGTTTVFSVRIKGNTMYLKGIGNPWNEVWKRLR
ncbi:hypothetical protein [Spirosoma foliorum]|uniref:Lipocalin-like domain-containing protein n=1 Tax=Spirosoma foliorum TaxID=2710596 RepID=A0A7G5H160_9BACT|nr:hypothetical protein [Spirosoma foliorum]QMW04852.1 hypothetical protein H3H32_08040 [Spirosoma foliorum]